MIATILFFQYISSEHSSYWKSSISFVLISTILQMEIKTRPTFLVALLVGDVSPVRDSDANQEREEWYNQ